MKAFANVNPRDFKDAVEKLRRPNAMAVGGGEPRQHGETTLARSPAMSATAPVVLVLP